ncbi:hypothetical protein OOA_08871 [Providencia burhodogranariea DSM 19968]|uniref:Big-1 domain-containing protein n=2 Tax=Providencia burhodogranariea TaxID=516074 RepID=K8WPX3_9GAMM|nr:hypothetical protein OOA_08871 [Providencia burhodogranariea DSM 19968]
MVDENLIIMNDSKADNNYIVALTIKVNNAPADGKSLNTVSVVCIDSTDFSPARGLNVVFTVISLGGTAFINESQTTIYPTTTDGIGMAVANIADTVAEDVIIRCHVTSDTASENTKTITFREMTDNFTIINATNSNHTFLREEPSIAWAGAEFTIHTRGGSRNISWNIENIISEVTVRGNADGSADVLIKEDPRREVRIIAKDDITDELVVYSFFLRDFVRSDRQKYKFSEAEDDYGNYLLPVATYERLFTQWGNLSSYFIWSTAVDETYWTNERARTREEELLEDEEEHENEDECDSESPELRRTYIVFDVRTGTKTTSSTSSKYRKYFMYKLP